MGWNFPKPIYWASAITTLVGGVILIKENVHVGFRDSAGGKLYTGNEQLTDKVVIVTGANTGIGKEVARSMAHRKAKVIMACRDLFKCENARQEIVLESKNKYVYCRKCDLASQESIRNFVKIFKKGEKNIHVLKNIEQTIILWTEAQHNKLHILINNAGVMRCPRSLTSEGIEMQLGVNHIGHFLLTNLLLDTIKASAPSRIINVSSTAHLQGKINVEDLNSEINYDPGDAYAQSKLANVLFTKELARRLKGTGVVVNAVHPGLVDTEIVRHMPFFNSVMAKIFMTPIFWLFMKTPKHGAQTTIYAALDPSLKDVSGAYFSNFQQSEESEIAKDDKLAQWLWKTSEKWAKLTVS